MIGFDQETEERAAEVWLNEGSGEMDADAINLLAVTGFNDCGREFCFSRNYVGEDACACVERYSHQETTTNYICVCESDIWNCSNSD